MSQRGKLGLFRRCSLATFRLVTAGRFVAAFWVVWLQPFTVGAHFAGSAHAVATKCRVALPAHVGWLPSMAAVTGHSSPVVTGCCGLQSNRKVGIGVHDG